MFPTVSISSLATFVECPYRLTCLEEDSTYFAEGQSFNGLKVWILSQLMRYQYNAVGLKGHATLTDLRRRLGKIWSEVRPQIQFELTSEHLLTIDSRVTRLYTTVPQDEVVGVDFPMSIRYKDLEITGTADAITMSRSGNLEVVIYDRSTWPCLTRVDTSIQLQGLFFYTAVKRSLPKFVSNPRIRIHRIVDGYTYTMAPSSASKLPTLIRPIYAGLSSGALHPRASKVTCTNCIYKETCEWSATNTTV